jgi:hypothetical protein
VKVEVIEDAAVLQPIVFDHVHFMVPEAALAKADAYYGKLFGFKRVSGEANAYAIAGGKVFSLPR